MNKSSLATIAVFLAVSGSSQTPRDISRVDSIAEAIDSRIANNVNIADFIHPVLSDEGLEPFLKHHYFIDTVKKVLYKSILDYTGFEQLDFYYSDQTLIKIIISDTSSKMKRYKYEYYFNGDTFLAKKEVGDLTSDDKGTIKTLSAVDRGNLDDFFGICKMLDKKTIL